MSLPTPYGNKVLVKRKGQPKTKIIMSSQEVINEGEVISIGDDPAIKVLGGDKIAFEYAIPTRFKDEDGSDYVLVPHVAILMVVND